MAYPRNLNKLCKWRTVLTGRILGTRSDTDPQAQGFNDLFEKFMILRVENTALTMILLKKGIVTEAELAAAYEDEADLLEKDYQQRFPGFRATDQGLEIDISKAAVTMKGWPV